MRLVKNAHARHHYGPGHRRLREQFAELVEAGFARCWRCNEPIEPGSFWELGHDDLHPDLHAGVEHRLCNRSAANQLKKQDEA